MFSPISIRSELQLQSHLFYIISKKHFRLFSKTKSHPLFAQSDKLRHQRITMNRLNQLRDALSQRILVLDGAMGSLIQTYKFSEEDFRGERFADHELPLKGNNDVLVLTQPDAIQAIHRQYFEAGADIVETNTFSGTRIAQADYGLEDAISIRDLNVAAARVARAAADEVEAQDGKPRFVAGALGPTNRTLSMSPDVNDPAFRAVSWSEMVEAYKEQARALLEGGVDILLPETTFDTLNLKAALFAIERIVGRRLRARAGHRVADDYRCFGAHFVRAAVGSGVLVDFARRSVRDFAQLRRWAPPKCGLIFRNCRVWRRRSVACYPNAGLPNAFGEYDDTPENMARSYGRMGARRLAQYSGRLLRHDARAYWRDGASG